MKIALYEQLQDVHDTRGKFKRADRLREYDTAQLRIILDLAFNPKIKIEVLPEIKYEPSRDSEQSLVYRLRQEAAKLRNITNVGPYPDLSIEKKTGILVKTLETIHPKDAILLLDVVNKQLPFDRITPELVGIAFPELAAGWE